MPAKVLPMNISSMKFLSWLFQHKNLENTSLENLHAYRTHSFIQSVQVQCNTIYILIITM